MSGGFRVHDKVITPTCCVWMTTPSVFESVTSRKTRPHSCSFLSFMVFSLCLPCVLQGLCNFLQYSRNEPRALCNMVSLFVRCLQYLMNLHVNIAQKAQNVTYIDQCSFFYLLISTVQGFSPQIFYHYTK